MTSKLILWKDQYNKKTSGCIDWETKKIQILPVSIIEKEIYPRFYTY